MPEDPTAPDAIEKPPIPVVDFNQRPAAPMEPGDLDVAPGEGMVRVKMLKPLTVTLDPADPTKGKVGGDRVHLAVGQYDIPASLADHWYVQAAVKSGTAVEVSRSDVPASKRRR